MKQKHKLARHLSAYLEGDLSARKQRAVERALEEDASLRQELAELRKLRSVLRDLPEPETPPFLASKVMARIEAGEAEPSLWVRFASSLQTRWLPSLATASCGFAAAAFLFGTEAGRDLWDRGANVAPLAADVSEPFRFSSGQDLIPSIDRIDTRGRASDGALTAAPRRSAPEPPPAHERSSNAPERAESAAPAVPAPIEVVEVAPSSAPVNEAESLDFKVCALTPATHASACDETYADWLALVREDAPAFNIRLRQVPGPLRSVWMKQLTVYAERTGQEVRFPEATPPSGGTPPHMLGFGPNGR